MYSGVGMETRACVTVQQGVVGLRVGTSRLVYTGNCQLSGPVDLPSVPIMEIEL